MQAKREVVVILDFSHDGSLRLTLWQVFQGIYGEDALASFCFAESMEEVDDT
jgi:hypothetical protein